MARAATNYDVSSIATTSVQLVGADGKTPVQQTVDGKTTNGPSIGFNATYLQVNISGTLKQRIAEGDTITIPLGGNDKTSHYLRSSGRAFTNLDQNVRDAQGRVLFTVTYMDGENPNRIILTATKTVANTVNVSFTVRPRFQLWANTQTRVSLMSKQSTWTVAGHTVTFANQGGVNNIDKSSLLNSSLAGRTKTGFRVYMAGNEGKTINEMIKYGESARSINQDRVIVATFTPLDGPISDITDIVIQRSWRLAYDANQTGTIEWRDVDFPQLTRIPVTNANQINTVNAAGRILKTYQYAVFKRADGVWQYAVNLGRIGNDSLPDLNLNDPNTQSTYDKARRLGLSAQILFTTPKIEFTVHGVRQRARVDFTTSYGNTGSYEGSNSLTSNDASGQPLGWVAYDGNGATGGSTESSTGVAGTLVDVAQNGFTRLGYKFSHWDTSRDGSGIDYYPADNGEKADKVQLVQTGTTLYAQWAPASAVVNYRGHPQDITGVMSSYHGLTGDAVNVSDNTGYSYPGHTFVGWCALKPGSVENDCTPNADTLDDTKVKLIKPGDGITLGDTGFQYSSYPDGTLVLDLYTVWKTKPNVGVLPATGGWNHRLLFITIGGMVVLAAGLPWMIRRFTHRDR